MAFSVGDFGLKIVITVVKADGSPRDVSASTAMNVILRKPDKSTVAKTAAFTTDGTDGRLEYSIEDASVLDVAGKWTARGQVTTSTVQSYKTEEVDFVVLP